MSPSLLEQPSHDPPGTLPEQPSTDSAAHFAFLNGVDVTEQSGEPVENATDTVEGHSLLTSDPVSIAVQIVRVPWSDNYGPLPRSAIEAPIVARRGILVSGDESRLQGWRGNLLEIGMPTRDTGTWSVCLDEKLQPTNKEQAEEQSSSYLG